MGILNENGQRVQELVTEGNWRKAVKGRVQWVE
jgi:hypothetical protein